MPITPPAPTLALASVLPLATRRSGSAGTGPAGVTPLGPLPPAACGLPLPGMMASTERARWRGWGAMPLGGMGGAPA